MTAPVALSEAELDRLRELAHIGASWAANSLARLSDRTILTRVPVMHGPERLEQRTGWPTGIFCDIHGDLEGLIAVFLSAQTREAVVELLCGDPDPPREILASALSEFGNILVSQTASAIANTLGGRILPSLPELVMEDAEAALQARLSPRHRPPPPIYIESELFDRTGRFRALHVVLPSVEKSGEGSGKG
jgi:chemotaxis protein CheY-P-specific phosphatase CheC